MVAYMIMWILCGNYWDWFYFLLIGIVIQLLISTIFSYSQSSISSFSCPYCQYNNEHSFYTGRQATGEEIFERWVVVRCWNSYLNWGSHSLLSQMYEVSCKLYICMFTSSLLEFEHIAVYDIRNHYTTDWDDAQRTARCLRGTFLNLQAACQDRQSRVLKIWHWWKRGDAGLEWTLENLIGGSFGTVFE